MDLPIQSDMMAVQKQTMLHSLQQCNDISQRYGLMLSTAQMLALVQERQAALVETGRIEMGAGILPSLIYAFCDSPYLVQAEYAQTLMALQSLFYTFKNDTDGILSDDELLRAMKYLYDSKGHGSLEYLENATLGDITSAAFGQDAEAGDGEDDAWDE